MISKDTFKKELLPVILKNEGGYANVKGDRGGETYRGISRNNWPNWVGWAMLEKHKPLRNGDMVNDPELYDAISEFYRCNYFMLYPLERCNNKIVAVQILDFAVHGGFSVRKLQQKLNDKFNCGLLVDGLYGDKTINAINAIDAQQACNLIISLRVEHLDNLVAKDPFSAKFETGWRNRINAMRHLIRGI